MKQDHLHPELRRKVNYLRNFRVLVCNDVPGGYLIFIVADQPNIDVGCGTGFCEDEIDAAIALAEKQNPELTARLNQQLTLF